MLLITSKTKVQGTNTFVSYGLKDQYETTEIHVNINIVHNDILDLEAFKFMSEEAIAGKIVSSSTMWKLQAQTI